jgi:hypothetical protein
MTFGFALLHFIVDFLNIRGLCYARRNFNIFNYANPVIQS